MADPKQTNLLKLLLELNPILIISNIIMAKAMSNKNPDNNPNSSITEAKIKSVWASGKNQADLRSLLKSLTEQSG